MIIIFKNWDTYNPPSSKTNSWLRLNSNLIGRPIWDELDNDSFRVFIYLLCQANESEKRGTIHVSTSGVSRRCTVSEKKALQTIEILKEFQIVEVRAPSGRIVNSALTLPTYERTNETIRNERNKYMPDSANPDPLDFDSLYKKYPRKEGKQKGLASCKSQIKNDADFDRLNSAIDAYTLYVKNNGIEPRFVKHFSTFMTSWRDWLDPETGTALEAKPEEPDWKKQAREEEQRNENK